MKRRNRIVLGLLLVAGLLGALKQRDYSSPATNTDRAIALRLAVAPYADTSLALFGDSQGAFVEQHIKLAPVAVNWSEQIELLVGGAVEVGMATLDEFMARDQGTRAIDRALVYFMPAWSFEALSFAAQADIVSFSTLRARYPIDEARKRFVAQLKQRKIALPEHSVFEQAIKKLILTAGEDPATFRFVHTSVEAGLNGLRDPKVAFAAIGNNQAPEAARRGYQLTPTAAELEIIVLTGFVTTRKFYQQQRAAVNAFARGWYRSVQLGQSAAAARYQFFTSYMQQRGGVTLSPAEFQATLASIRIAASPTDALAMFDESTSLRYWRTVWDDSAVALQASGAKPPQDASGFVALEFLKGLE